MTTQPIAPSTTAAELRRHFDEGFAKAPAAVAEEGELLLAIRLGGAGYAVSVGEIAGLFKDRPLKRLPSPVSEFVGLAGIRGSIVPVYDLAALLGLAPARNPSWLVLAKAAEALAFAFEALEGQLRARRGQASAGRDPSRPHLAGSIEIGSTVRQILDLSSLLEAVKARVRPGGRAKER